MLSASQFVASQTPNWSKAASAAFTLIELMIALVLFGLLLTFGLPSFATWLQNSQVRTAAESINAGLQLARAEAVRRNVKVIFQLTSAGAQGLSDWSVAANVDIGAPDFEVAIQSRSSAEGSANARIGVSSAMQPDPAFSSTIAGGTGLPANVVFTPVGRVESGGITRVDVTSAALAAAETRRLVILISPGGQIRLCDPLHTVATNPQGCA